MGVILFLVARFLQWVLTPVFFIYAIIRLRNFKKISEYFHDVAFGIDQLGNVMGGPIMNDVLIKDSTTYPYGDPDITISNCTGVNEKNNNLTKWGKLLAWILNKIDPNHTTKAVENEQ